MLLSFNALADTFCWTDKYSGGKVSFTYKDDKSKWYGRLDQKIYLDNKHNFVNGIDGIILHGEGSEFYTLYAQPKPGKYDKFRIYILDLKKILFTCKELP